VRVVIVGGFLGAGKTTLIRSLARKLREDGEQVVVVTNDQGDALVDTHLCRADAVEQAAVAEVTGGCFCCRFDDLEVALVAARGAGATVAVAEAVGSCTDLVATVLSPLAERQPGIEVAPLAIAVDPWRVRQMGAGQAHDDVVYLFHSQIREADVVLLTRSDQDPPAVNSEVRALAPHAAVVRVSGLTGDGIEDWMAAAPDVPASPLAGDYERYAAAEALLGWANATVEVSDAEGVDPGRFMHDVLGALSDTPVAHFKLVCERPGGGSGSIVRQGSEPVVDTGTLPDSVPSARFLLNARIALSPDELEARLRSAAQRAVSDSAEVRWTDFECFRPAPPTPTHRHSFRCGTGDDASCCAAFYDRAEIRYLLGDSLHPGGIELTLRMAEQLALGPDSSLLDVACGRGTSLKAIRQLWPLKAVGLDAGLPGGVAAPGAETSGLIELHRGDVHSVPFPDATFDAALCECALSTFADQGRALGEMRRVLRPGGRVAISDMVVAGSVPTSLEDWVNVGTCLAGALSAEGYHRVLESAGFRIVDHWHASDALHEMVARIKRNLLGLVLAGATGNLPEGVHIDVDEARELLHLATEAIDEGVIGYGVYIAERPT